MSESNGLRLSSMRARCPAAEWQARVDLAACYRLVALSGMSDMRANHFRACVQDEHGAFLINAYGMLYEEITASSSQCQIVVALIRPRSATSGHSSRKTLTSGMTGVKAQQT